MKLREEVFNGEWVNHIIQKVPLAVPLAFT